jgi:hypothetical protein
VVHATLGVHAPIKTAARSPRIAWTIQENALTAEG